jgi:hypothetical protein
MKHTEIKYTHYNTFNDRKHKSFYEWMNFVIVKVFSTKFKIEVFECKCQCEVGIWKWFICENQGRKIYTKFLYNKKKVETK